MSLAGTHSGARAVARAGKGERGADVECEMMTQVQEGNGVPMRRSVAVSPRRPALTLVLEAEDSRMQGTHTDTHLQE
jgi:hypothetical protein